MKRVAWTQAWWAMAAVALLFGPSALAHDPGRDGAPEGQLAALGSLAAGATPLGGQAPSRSDEARYGLGDQVVPRAAPMPIALTVPGRGSNSNANDHAPEIRFECQSQPDPTWVVTSPSDRTYVVYGCPYLIFDEQFPLGNVDLDVDPTTPDRMAFTAIHGRASEDGPTNRSRSGQPHTTFMSFDGGATWWDSETGRGYPTQDVSGEDASVTFDREGGLHFSLLWSQQQRRQEGMLRTFKAVDAGDMALRPNLIYGQHWDSPEPTRDYLRVAKTEVALVPSNGHPGVATGGVVNVEESVKGFNGTGDRIVTLWLEQSFAQADAQGRPSGNIRYSVTHTGPALEWNVSREDREIGPCLDMSNAVVYQQKVYVSCTVAENYTHRDKSVPQENDLWAVDPWTGEVDLVGRSILEGMNPRLAINSHGYMVMMTAELPQVFQPSIKIAFGWEGLHWHGSQYDIGPLLHGMAGGTPLDSVHITGLAVSERQPTAFFVYKQHNQIDDNTTVSAADPTGELLDYTKIVAAMNECDGILAAAQFQLGSALMPYNYETHSEHPEAFDDFRDGFTMTVNPEGRQMIHFAVTDYGAVQFGAIDVQQALGDCPVPPNIASLPIPPLPAPITVGSISTTLVGSASGLMAAAMIGYLLTVKRRNAHVVSTEA